MKRLVVICVCFVIVVTNGYAQRKYKGEKGISSIGAMVGYAIESETPVVGVDFRYNVLNKLRLAPSVLYAFEKHDTDILYFNADVHYLARISETATLYPLGGFGMSTWSLKRLDDMIFTERTVRLGLNLGFGGEVRLSKDIIIGAEFRYNWTSGFNWSRRYYNQAMLLVRAAFYF
jgi:opacity protein-like surface antigen